MPQLEELYISDNALETLNGLENNTKLRILEISNNKVTSLSGLEPLAELEEIWASYNLLADFAEVEKVLKDKKGLTTVYFEGTPLQTRGPALYRNKVRLALPQLSQIDASTWLPIIFPPPPLPAGGLVLRCHLCFLTANLSAQPSSRCNGPLHMACSIFSSSYLLS